MCPATDSATFNEPIDVVCLHGFLGDSDEWQPVIDCLPPRLRCHAPLLPGHDGNSPSGKTFDGLVDALWDKLEPQLPQFFVLVGYSLGGRLALGLARRYPERLRALILEAAHPGLQDSHEREDRKRHDAGWAKRFLNRPWLESLEAWYRQPVFADLTEIRRRALIQRRSRHNPQHLAATLRAASLAGQPDLRPTLHALKIPVAYIVGAHDKKFSAIADTLLAELGSGLQRFQIAGVGHNCHIEAPEAIAAIIQRICTEDIL